MIFVIEQCFVGKIILDNLRAPAFIPKDVDVLTSSEDAFSVIDNGLYYSVSSLIKIDCIKNIKIGDVFLRAVGRGSSL